MHAHLKSLHFSLFCGLGRDAVYVTTLNLSGDLSIVKLAAGLAVIL